jgi:L-ribulose-5-phosphate 3-epimerase
MQMNTHPIGDIGFMQGRLSPQVNGMIQAFPWDDWQQEFPQAQTLGIGLMEWTLDRARLDENPLMTEAGRRRIAELSAKHGVRVGSLTGDIFMQAPFWRVTGEERQLRLREFDRVADACAAAGIRFIVVPLVDNGAMHSPAEEDLVVAELSARADWLASRNLAVVFECDYLPADLARFIARLPAPVFGINYDIGNSAALDYDCDEEFAAYGGRILNVHIKDRLKGGTTVPLGTGNARLAHALGSLVRRGYAGSYILQTARAADGDHAGALRRYRDLALGWLRDAA